MSGGHAAGLELRGVTKVYGALRAVDDISLVVPPGEFLTLLGPSGCGKTSLLNIIAGFLTPGTGQVVLNGRDITSLPPYRRNIGVVFQNYALFPHMTVAQNIGFGLVERRLKKPAVRDQVAQALAMVRLEAVADRRPSQLSGGQQQRVALARALVIQPQLLLLDEPLSALDKNLRTHMQIELREIQRQTGVTTVFVTHDQAEALSLSDRIAVLNCGRIEQLGSAREVYARPCSPFVAGFVGETNVFAGVIAAGGRVDLDIGTAFKIEAGFVPGSRISVYVRPENIAIVPQGAGRANVVDGVVAAHSYQGSATLVVAQVAGMEVLLTVAGAEVMERHPPGSAVRLQLNISGAAILPA